MSIVSEEIWTVILSEPRESLLKLVLSVSDPYSFVLIILTILTLLLKTSPVHPNRSFGVAVQLMNQPSIFCKRLLEREQLLPIKEWD